MVIVIQTYSGTSLVSKITRKQKSRQRLMTKPVKCYETRAVTDSGGPSGMQCIQ